MKTCYYSGHGKTAIATIIAFTAFFLSTIFSAGVDKAVAKSIDIGLPEVITFLDEAGKQRIYTFVTGSDYHLHVNYWDGAKWFWADQGQPSNKIGVQGKPGVITYRDEDGKQRIYVFVVGSDNRLYVNYWDGAIWRWTAQGNPPNVKVLDPGVITYRDEAGKQRIYAFVWGFDRHLYVNYWDGFQWRWADQGQPPNTVGYGQEVVTYRDESGKQRIYAFAWGLDKHLYVNYWDGFQWYWADQGPPSTTELFGLPGVITYPDADGKQRIYGFIGGSDQHLYVNYWDGSQWHWADQGKPPNNTLPVFASKPSVITYIDEDSKQRIYAFVRGFNDRLYVNYWDGSQWHWAAQGRPLDAPIYEDSKAISYLDETGKQRIYVFVLGSNNELYINFWDGFKWRWANQGSP